MNEIDQHSQAQDCEDQPCHDRNVRNKRLFIASPDASQDEQAVDESRNKGSEDDLIAAVIHEIPQEPRAELLRRKGEGNDRYRKDNAGHANGSSRDGTEHLAGAFSSAVLAPTELPLQLVLIIDIQPDGEYG
jgi:hypothetical protein